MKALTVRQPWASLIARGLKAEEARDWLAPVALPFRLAVRASRAVPSRSVVNDLRAFAAVAGLNFAPVTDGQLLEWVGSLPRGKVLAVCSVVAVRQPPAGDPLRRWGRWAWQLADVRELDKPIHALGQLGLWDWSGPAAEAA
jgi:hypothetical protein